MNRKLDLGMVDNFNRYFDTLNGCFVGRERVINLLKLALLQRQHLLVFGPPGTSKTAICDAAFSGIEDANKFRIELSMFMGEDAIFGPYDTKLMREEGVLHHRTEGMLPEADLARLGEMLDGNMPILRSMLGALHERQMRRGQQIIEMPLLTVFCDTNINPGDFLKRNHNAWAVLDRILFMARIDYIDDDQKIYDMLDRFQSGRVIKRTERLSLRTIQQLSDLVVNPPSLITDQLLLMKFAQALGEYRRRRQQLITEEKMEVILPRISDRRLCFASQMMEIAAILGGRTHVIASDMDSAHFALGTTETERELWQTVIGEKKEEYEKEREAELDKAQGIALDAVEKQLSAVNDQLTIEEAKEQIEDAKRALGAIQPTTDVVRDRREFLIARLGGIEKAQRERAWQEGGNTTPKAKAQTRKAS